MVELLIVIVIIGILAVALLPRVAGAPARARDEQRKADVNSMVTVLEQYNGDLGYYPVGTAAATSCFGVSTTDTIHAALIPAYLQDAPSDPNTTNSPVSGCSGGYFYKSLTNSGSGTTATNYIIVAKLERAITAPTDGIYCTSTALTSTTFASYTASVSTINGWAACSATNSTGYYIVVR